MEGFLVIGLALMAATLLSAIVAVREYRRRNFWLAGFALFCFALCVATFFVPIPPQTVRVEVPNMGNAR